MDVGCTLHLGLRLWALASASRAVSVVAELLVKFIIKINAGHLENSNNNDDYRVAQKLAHHFCTP